MQEYSSRAQAYSFPVLQGGKPGFEGSDAYQKKIKTRPKSFGPYVVLHTIGEGEFAKVKLALHKETGQEVAIKLVKKEWIDNQIKKAKIVREITSLRAVNHKNVVRLFDVIESENHIGLVLEYASGGELFDYIMKHKALSNAEARRIFAQLILAVSHLHKNQIVHRDLKLENLLLDKSKNVKITDFGFANHFDAEHGEMMITSCGSPCYAAPELVVSNGMYVGTMVDVWSCGVILYAMVAGYLPYDDDDNNPNGENINQLYKYILSKKLDYPSSINSLARNLLERMLVADPTKRATLEEVRAHPWLAPHRSIFSEFDGSGDFTNNGDGGSRASRGEAGGSELLGSNDKSKATVVNSNTNSKSNGSSSGSWLNRFAKKISAMSPQNNNSTQNSNKQHHPPTLPSLPIKEEGGSSTGLRSSESSLLLKRGNDKDKSKSSRRSVKPVASIMRWFTFKRSNLYYCKQIKYPSNDRLVFKGSHSALTARVFAALKDLCILTDVDYATAKTPVKKIVCTRPKLVLQRETAAHASLIADLQLPQKHSQQTQAQCSASKPNHLSTSLLSCFYHIKKSLNLNSNPHPHSNPSPVSNQYSQNVAASNENTAGASAKHTDKSSIHKIRIDSSHNSNSNTNDSNEKQELVTSLELPSEAYEGWDDTSRVKLVIKINLIENTQYYCLEFARLKGTVHSYNYITNCIVDKLDF